VSGPAEVASLAEDFNAMVAERRRAEEALRETHKDLETRVKERTGDLTSANQRLQEEVAERIQAEKALRESEAKYRQIFENVQDIFYRTDAKGIITEISPSVERYGYTREQLIGTNVLDVYENPGERSSLIDALLTHGEVVDYEARLKRGDGGVADASVSSHVLRDDGSSEGHHGA
jgi:PAS domain S-box-containing protein